VDHHEVGMVGATVVAEAAMEAAVLPLEEHAKSSSTTFVFPRIAFSTAWKEKADLII